MRISDWSSDVCSSDLAAEQRADLAVGVLADDHVLAVDRNATKLLLVTGVAHAVPGGPGAQHGQRRVRAGAEHFRMADACTLAYADRPAGVRVRPEERRVGNRCVRSFRYRWMTAHSKKKKN